MATCQILRSPVLNKLIRLLSRSSIVDNERIRNNAENTFNSRLTSAIKKIILMRWQQHNVFQLDLLDLMHEPYVRLQRLKLLLQSMRCQRISYIVDSIRKSDATVGFKLLPSSVQQLTFLSFVRHVNVWVEGVVVWDVAKSDIRVFSVLCIAEANRASL